MKKHLSLILAIAMTFAMVFSACGKTQAPADNSGTAGTPAAATETEKPAKANAPVEAEKATEPEFVLTFSDYNIENCSIGDWEKTCFAMIEERSNGRIKIDPYFSGTLLEAMDTWSGTSNGLADISYYFITLSTGVQTVGEVFTQYFTYNAPNLLDAQPRYREALAAIPEIEAEANAANLTILDVAATDGAVYGFAKEHDIKAPEDTKGMIFQAQGHYTDALASIGASGTSLYPSDWYTSLERGVVDALTMNWAGMRDFGLTDISNYYLTFGENGGLYAGGCAYIMNLDTWNSLPEDLQVIVKECFQEAVDGLIAQDYQSCQDVKAAEIAAGKTVANIPADEMQPWYDLAQKSVDLWIEDCNAAGYDGQAIWDAYVKIMTEAK